jgi:hypothetical protein
MANCTAAEPNIEKACPAYIIANCFFQFIILFIFKKSPFIKSVYATLQAAHLQKHNFIRKIWNLIFLIDYVFKHNK